MDKIFPNINSKKLPNTFKLEPLYEFFAKSGHTAGLQHRLSLMTSLLRWQGTNWLLASSVKLQRYSKPVTFLGITAYLNPKHCSNQVTFGQRYNFTYPVLDGPQWCLGAIIGVDSSYLYLAIMVWKLSRLTLAFSSTKTNHLIR